MLQAKLRNLVKIPEARAADPRSVFVEGDSRVQRCLLSVPQCLRMASAACAAEIWQLDR
jgi:hypothetical protein